MTAVQTAPDLGTTNATVVQLIARQVAGTPHAVAVADNDGRWTYAQLHEQALRVAAALRNAGVIPGDRIGLSTTRDRRAVAAVLGVMYAGCPYVPIDPSYPVARRQEMAAAAGLTVLLAAEPLAGVPVLRLADLSHALPLSAPHPVAPTDLAYVIFTSGSTGTPKGVQVTHGNLAALLSWCVTTFGDDLARTATTTSLNFDPSVIELFGPLTVGGQVYALEGPFALEAADAHPSFLQSAPSVMLELALAGHVPASVRTLLTGGEPLVPNTARRLLAGTGLTEMFNCYGPTEATVLVTAERVTLQSVDDITIGREITGTRIVLLSPDGTEVPDGQVGELTVLGAQVAAGYAPGYQTGVGRDTFASYGGEPAYRTGDLARRRSDQRIEFHGRADRQVKIRGFRVELPEVENHLLAVAGVREAAVVATDRGTAGAQLVAYLVGDKTLDPDELLVAMQKRVQSYLVPSHFVQLPALPRTVSGKIDSTALPALIRPEHVPITNASSVAEIVADALQLADVPADSADLVTDLRATSLSLIRILSLIEERLDVRIPIATVLGQTTVGDLTRLVAGEGRRTAITLNEQGRQEPMLLTAAYIGDVLRYRSLAACLPDVPITIILARQPYEQNRPTTVGSMAENVVAQLGPKPGARYRIGGHSAGGLVAYETARQLIERGVAVDAVVLFDTPGPRGRFGYHWGDLVMNLPEFFGLSWTDKLARLRRIVLKRSSRFRANRSSPLEAAIAAGDALNNSAVMRYRADPIPGLGLLAVLTTRQGFLMAMGRRRLGWSTDTATQVVAAPVAGNHTTLFDPSNLPRLVARVEEIVGT